MDLEKVMQDASAMVIRANSPHMTMDQGEARALLVTYAHRVERLADILAHTMRDIDRELTVFSNLKINIEKKKKAKPSSRDLLVSKIVTVLAYIRANIALRLLK
jgi:hypothetical protein